LKLILFFAFDGFAFATPLTNGETGKSQWIRGETEYFHSGIFTEFYRCFYAIFFHILPVLLSVNAGDYIYFPLRSVLSAAGKSTYFYRLFFCVVYIAKLRQLQVFAGFLGTH